MADIRTRPDELNRVHHKNFLSNTLPDKSVQLIISDPPYFEVKGHFDFIWSSFEDYLKDVERWAIECKRILADNGTLFWWGMDINIAYSQTILDRHFNLINTMVWERPGLSSEWDTRRSFPNRGMERLLFYANDFDDLGLLGKTGLERIKDDPALFSGIKAYLRSEREASGLPMSWFISVSSTYASHYFALTSQWAFPTEKDYKAFSASGFFSRPYEELRAEYEELRAEYEELRAEYEELRRPFDNFLGLTDVLKFSQDAHSGAAKEYDHETKKPEKLTRALILTCSRPGDIVCAPFSGSGTEVAMAAKERRRWIGYDIERQYVDMANERTAKELKQSTVFDMMPTAGPVFEQAKLF